MCNRERSWYIASGCLMPKAFQKDNVSLSQKPPQLLCCVRLSGFRFPLLWHFHCSNQRPFPLGLSTVEIENSCSLVLWIVGTLCTLGPQVFRVTSNTWRGHRGEEFWSWKGPSSSSNPISTQGRGSICNFYPPAILGLCTNTSRTGNSPSPKPYISSFNYLNC